jgi:hypothetical protein
VPAPPEFDGVLCVPLRAEEAAALYANGSGGTLDGQGAAMEAKLQEIARCGDSPNGNGERAAILGHRLWPQTMLTSENGDPTNDNMLHVRFSTKEHAAWALDPRNPNRLPSFGEKSAFGFYNDVKYLNRGWPTFETGCASTVEAHMYRNQQQPRRAYNPDFEAAENFQPKLTNISNLQRQYVRIQKPVKEVLDKAYADLQTAKFTGKGDQEAVIQMLKDYEEQIFSFVKKERDEIAARELQATPEAIEKIYVGAKSMAPDMASKSIAKRWKHSEWAKQKQEKSQHGLARSMSSLKKSSTKVLPVADVELAPLPKLD